MINDIEIQVIKSKTTPVSWFDQAYDSIATQIPEKNIKVYESSELGMLHQRLHFIENCKTTFLGWVDDKDFILPGTLIKCRTFLQGEQSKQFCGIFTAMGLLKESTEFKTISDVDLVKLGGVYSTEKHLLGESIPNPFQLFRTVAAKHALSIPAKFYSAKAYSSDLISGYALLYGPWRKLLEPLYINRAIMTLLDFDTSDSLKKIVYNHLRSVVGTVRSKQTPIITEE